MLRSNFPTAAHMRATEADGDSHCIGTAHSENGFCATRQARVPRLTNGQIGFLEYHVESRIPEVVSDGGLGFGLALKRRGDSFFGADQHVTEGDIL